MKFITFSYKDDDNETNVLYVNEELLLSINITKQTITIEFNEIGVFDLKYSPEIEKAILEHMTNREELLKLTDNTLFEESWKDEIQTILNKDEKS